jgi:uncharacterized membrane protein
MRVFLKILSLALFLLSLYVLYLSAVSFEMGFEQWQMGIPDNLGLAGFWVFLTAGLGLLAASIIAYRKSGP